MTVRPGKSKPRAPIYGGMLVTKLARSYGVFDDPGVEFLKWKEGHPFQPRLFKSAIIVKDMGNNTYSVPVDDEVVVAAVPPSGAPSHYTYIPYWEEHWAENRGGMGTSGARDGDDKEEE
ncbi:unnamed protein product [Lactuca saligna]|uniref:Uncharacterized protein n=1 Tax=Lactuca saligna TaxID=75948 RepID=A0AA36E4Q2_LACSI|nr:unnamed protein product [Lactuca saligna]